MNLLSALLEINERSEKVVNSSFRGEPQSCLVHLNITFGCHAAPLFLLLLLLLQGKIAGTVWPFVPGKHLCICATRVFQCQVTKASDQFVLSSHLVYV